MQHRTSLTRWLDAVALIFTLLAFAAWLAETLFVLCQASTSDTIVYHKIAFFDALLPGIVGGGMLVAAAEARRRQRMRGARLFGLGGLVALSLSLLADAFAGKSFVYESPARRVTFVEIATVATMLLGAKAASAVLIGVIRWAANRLRRRSATDGSHDSGVVPGFLPAPLPLPLPVGRLQDLLSFLAVLFMWFCVVPVPPNWATPLVVAGPSIFVAGFPVGLVGVVALLAAGLLRAGRDGQRVVALEIFGVVVLTIEYAAAALPFAQNLGEIKNDPVRNLMLASWALFGAAMAAKLILIAAGLLRRRERLQFTLHGILAFMVGCGALAVYWRAWRS